VKLLLVQPKSLQECSIIFEDAAKAAALLPAQNIAQGSRCIFDRAHALLNTVLRIRFRRIHIFLGLPDPDPFIIKQKMVIKTLIPTLLRLLYYFLSLKNDVNVPSKVISKKRHKKITLYNRIRSASGSIIQGYGSADPDPYQISWIRNTG
jgi:hypothetical protein